MSVRQRNNVQAGGNGATTVIFSHGFGGDQAFWRYMVPWFETRYKTVLFDLTGSGRSDHAAYDRQKYGSLTGYAADLLEIIDEFAGGPVIFIGHSVSANIGMLASIQSPKSFAALIMIAPSPSFINDGDYHGGFRRSDIDALLKMLENNYRNWSNGIAPTIMGNPERPELGDEMAASLCRVDPEIAKHFARVTFLEDHRKELARITTPTLILQCSEDIFAPVCVGEYMHRTVPGSTMNIIDNVGHCPHLSAPLACIDACNAFLRDMGH